VDAKGPDYAERVADHWAGIRGDVVRSFWQSPVVMAEIERRITGEPGKKRLEYFRERYCPEPFRLALSLGCGHGFWEREMVELGICERAVGIDVSAERLERARAAVPPEHRDRIEYVQANLEEWRPEAEYDLVVCKAILHHIEALEEWAETIAGVLRPDGLLYFDDYVGPTRFQWTDTQLRVINRLLSVLPDWLLLDLTRHGKVRRHVGRPDLEKFIAADPSEAIRSEEILPVLARYFEPVELRPYGGAIYHGLFTRVMGNFAGEDALVRVLLELDGILMDEGVVETNYLWGVYRPR
jgi:SAM-dependent methyltransferase